MLTFPLCVGDVVLFAQVLAKSGLLTERKTPEELAALIVIGQELGLSSIQSLRLLTLERGVLVVSSDMLLMLTKKNAACLYFVMVECTSSQAIYETHRREEPGPTRLVYTPKEANLAGDEANIAILLRERCIEALVRQVYPELMVGLEVRFSIPQKKQPEGINFNEKTRRFILEDLYDKARKEQSVEGLRALANTAKNCARARVMTEAQLAGFLSCCKELALRLGLPGVSRRVQEKLQEIEAAQSREELDELRLWFDGIELTQHEKTALTEALQRVAVRRKRAK